MQQLISCLRVALVDTILSLPISVGGVIPVSEVPELLIKVHNILDNAVSKLNENIITHILAHVLILLPGSIMRSGLHSPPFFMVSRMCSLLVRFACMAI